MINEEVKDIMDEQMMEAALTLAREAAAEGEVPVGCVITLGDRIVGRGRNRREQGKSALAHAELEAIEEACRTLGGWRLWQCTLYVTLEPCPMCAGAIINARIPRVVYGAKDPKAGSCGSVIDLFMLPYNHKPQVEQGLLEAPCAALLSEFFQTLREKRRLKKSEIARPVSNSLQPDTQVNFVLAQETDAMSISQLRQTVWANTYRGIYPDEMIDSFDYAWHTAKDLERIKSSNYSVYLITAKTQNIGYMTIRQSSPVLLTSLYILPAFQKRGIGKLSFHFIKEYCKERAQSSFLCQCQPDNRNAMCFYQRMGGRIVGRDMGNPESWQNSVTFQFDVDEVCR